MRILPKCLSRSVRDSTKTVPAPRSSWLMPRAIYATSNPCLAANPKLLTMTEKCCSKKQPSYTLIDNDCCVHENLVWDSVAYQVKSSTISCVKENVTEDQQLLTPPHKTTEEGKQSPNQPTRNNMQFYRRTLPSTCISFGSSEGKLIFGEALVGGYMNCYFPLAAQFRTQEEPAFCGLTTLVMVLNALAVDPGRVWKGPWRWYHENMLDCCVPLTRIETQGITLDQFTCLAACNALNVQTVRPDLASPTLRDADLNKFRDLVKKMSQRDDAFIVCSYSRRLFSQTGDGHFSPVGGFHPGRDLVLILDTARFKYPPHWVPLTTLWEAMLAVDPSTDLNRGFSLVQRLDSLFKADSQLIFKPSEYFSVNAPSQHRAMVESFILGFESWAIDSTSPINDAVVEEAVEKLVQLLGASQDDFHLLTTREDGISCSDAKAPVTIPLQNACLMTDLISSIKNLPIYAIVERKLKTLSRGDADKTRSTQIGRSLTKRSILCESSDCGASSAEVVGIDAAEFATMFLLAWPFDDDDNVNDPESTATCNNLRAYVHGLLETPLSPILQQEVGMLKHQLRQIKRMFLE